MSKDKTHWAGRLGRWTRLHLLRALRENASPGRTALGLALGAFIGIVPSFMVGAPLAFFLAGRLGWNRAAAVAGSVLSMNPLTAPFLYSLSAWLGFEITGRHVTVEVEGLINNLRDYAFPFLVGNAVVALAIAVVLGLVMFSFGKKVPAACAPWSRASSAYVQFPAQQPGLRNLPRFAKRPN